MNVNENDSDVLKVEQVRVLYSHLPTSLTVNLLLGVILVAVQSTAISAPPRLGWLAVLCTVLLVRALLFRARRRAGPPTAGDASRWLRRFRIAVVATGAIWGAGSIMLSPAGHAANQVFIAFAIGGLCAGAITSLAIDRVSTVGFLLPALAPFVVYLALQSNAVSLGMSAMSAVFLVFITVSARVSERALHDNLALRIRAVADEARFRAMLEYSPIAARITDVETNRVLFANPSYAALLGLEADQAVGAAPVRFYANPDEYAAVVDRLSRGEKVTDQLVELTPANKPDEHKWALATYLRTEYRGEPADLGWFYDITERKRMEEQIRYLAYHDPLTELPNRVLLRDRLRHSLAIAERASSALALMFIDLDEFKRVNDAHGHDVGDSLLRGVAERLSKNVRQSDSVARIGGDEFVVLLTTIRAAEDALVVAEQIRAAVDQPFILAERTLHISPSIGVAIYPEHATNESDLIRLADAAMYCAKAAGRNTVRLYDPGVDGTQ
ncbi:MAG: sensor domain-containing diguanylate cyclase [Gammaproteobacteria bacterium]